MKVLVAEDDAETRDYVGRGLRELGHVVTAVETGTDALFHATSEIFDAIVLDRMLPGLDGLAALRSMRAAGVATPALMLTALARVEVGVVGGVAGAEDFLVKPFAFSELVARLNALGRRPAAVSAETVLRAGDLPAIFLAEYPGATSARRHGSTRRGTRAREGPRKTTLRNRAGVK